MCSEVHHHQVRSVSPIESSAANSVNTKRARVLFWKCVYPFAFGLLVFCEGVRVFVFYKCVYMCAQQQHLNYIHLYGAEFTT